MTKAQLLKALSEALSNLETAFSEAEIAAGTLGDAMDALDDSLFEAVENLHMMASQTAGLVEEVVGCIESLDQDIRDGDFDEVWK